MPGFASKIPARLPVLGPFLAATLAVVAYANGLWGGFVWDDRILILEGQLPRAWSSLVDIWTRDFFHRSDFDLAYGYYRPLATISYIWDYSWWRLDPFGYHLTNVVAHAFNSALAVLLLSRLGIPAWGALWAGCWFAAHPIHSESVAWIAGRTDVLAFLLAGSAFWLDLGRQTAPQKSPALRRIAIPTLFGLALLTKEAAIALPLWMLVVHWGRFRRSLAESAWRLAPYAGVVAVYGLWRFLLIEVGGPGQPPDRSLIDVALNFVPTLMGYVGWMVWPLEQSAYVINPAVESLLDTRLWFPVGALALLLFGADRLTRGRDDRRTGAILAAMTVAGLLPVLIVRPSGPLDMGEMMAERFVYFASLPMAGLLAWLGGAIIDRGRLYATAAAATALTTTTAVLSLAAATAATVERNRSWADELTFLETNLATAPQSALLWSRLAEHHLELEDLEAAEKAIAAARAANDDPDAAIDAEALLRLLRGDKPGALRLQQRIVSLTRNASGPARNNLAYLYRITGQPERARRLLLSLIDEGHVYSDVHANLAEVYRDEGNAALARQHYLEALRDRPDDRQVAGALVSLEVAEGRLAEAEAIYQKIRRFHPNDLRILNNIAMLRMRRGDLRGAERLLRELLEREPGYANARVNLAQVMREQGRNTAAIAALRNALPQVTDASLRRRLEAQMERWTADTTAISR